MAPQTSPQSASLRPSLTAWWNLLSDALDVLQTHYPEIQEKRYFQGAREMIDAGRQTESTNFLFLYSNKKALERAEVKLGKAISRRRAPNDSLELPGYIPLINSNLSLQFALVFYQHLLRYDSVLAQGKHAKMLQMGMAGDASGECIEYYQPFTRNAAEQLKEQIKGYIFENQNEIFEFLNEDDEAFETLCTLVAIKPSELDDLFYFAPETPFSAQSNTRLDDTPTDAHADIIQLKNKLADYFKLYFRQLNETDPVILLQFLSENIQTIKKALDEIIFIKQVIEAVQSAKEASLAFHEFILSDEIEVSVDTILLAEEKIVLEAHLRPLPQSLSSVTAPAKVSKTYQFFTAVAPTHLKHAVDWTFGWQAPEVKTLPTTGGSVDTEGYEWLIDTLKQRLKNRSTQLTARLNTPRTSTFEHQDFTDASIETLSNISTGLSTCTETLSEVEKAIDKYITKHRFGIGKFVDYKPIRLMTSFFVKIGFSLVINDKFFYFEKARDFKKQVTTIKEALARKTITTDQAKDNIKALSTDLERYSQERDRRSQYFRYFGPIRSDCRRASEDLSKVANHTHQAIAAPAA